MSAADTAIAFARSQLGKPYQWGATGPNAYDCSGLVMVAYRKAGVNLPRTTYQMLLKGTPIPKASLMPGDLVFPDAGHVGIYLGGGKMIHAPHTGDVVKISDVWRFYAGRRVTSPATSPAPNGQPADWEWTWTPGLPIPGIPIPTNPSQDIPGFGALSQLIQAVNTIQTVLLAPAKAAVWLTDTHNWLRMAEFMMGIVLLIIALIGLSRTSVSKVAKGVARAA